MQSTVCTNRLYQVNGTGNLSSWVPVTDWLQAANNPTMNHPATNTGTGWPFYRVQVKP